ncbi:MAG TPA: ATPase, T2SS/T4P/T4SS family, partial [Diaminobutyricibacter sp.]
METPSSTTPTATPFVPIAPETHSTTTETGPIDWRQFGPLAPYVARDGVTDIFVNGAQLWCDGDEGVQRLEGWSADERATRELAVRLIGLGGRHVDEATPFIDVRLAGGVRVHAVLPPISTTGTLLSIRVPRRERLSLDDLVSAGSVSSAQAAILRTAIAQRLNLLVTGAAGAGKTTLLGAMLAEAPAHERIVLIEDVAELRVSHPHVVGLQARQANLEGAGSVGLQQ